MTVKSCCEARALILMERDATPWGLQGANRNKSGSHLVPRPGMVGLFGTVALGALVMAADVGEMLCSVGDRIAFSTPLGVACHPPFPVPS